MMSLKVKLLLCAVLYYGNSVLARAPDLSISISERIGNFSIEFLYHTATSLKEGENFISSPITVWSALALITEGAAYETRLELVRALHLPGKNKQAVRDGFSNITKYLSVNTSTIELAKLNTIFVDKERLPVQSFMETADTYYQTNVIAMDFTNSVNTSEVVNSAISKATHGKIPKIIEPDYFQERQMVLTSALYFKGQWTSPFNKTNTSKMPFYNSKGQQIGDVNMMYGRYNYPFASIRDLQAKVLEIPYGVENRLSMLILLPNPGISVEEMFLNFQKVHLDTLFQELTISKEEYSEDEVDCYLPRFKVESDLDLTNVLRDKMGIDKLFDQTAASLPYLSNVPTYVTKIVHKARIEVTEEGTEAAAVTAAEFSNRIGIVQFMVNRPFTFVIVEKITNSIVFSGIYKTPSLF